MQPKNASIESSNRPDSLSLDSILNALIDQLEAKRSRVVDEIRVYPSPIPACDAQFNYLLEQRAKLSQELGQLQQIAKNLPLDENDVKSLQALIESSDCIDSGNKDQIMAVCTEEGNVNSTF